ncbi:hypothetical protein EXIGLDRAFT_581121, partial [Exidia glandulosa HHB12029]
GAVLELKSMAAADWLREDARRASFQTHFAAGATIKLRPYNVLVKNVPVNFDPSNAKYLRDLEVQNGLPESVLTGARWWKPVERRRKDQQNAHMMVSFSKPEWANYAI